MVFDRKLGDSFKKSSVEYHSSRKGYSSKVYTKIIKISKINNQSKILDIGCGSGLSTLPIAKLGYSITGIDTSERLIEIARKETIEGNPTYILDSFEKHYFNDNQFDLIISGQAFHWLDENTAYEKCAKALKKEGHIAIFGKFNDYKKSDFLNKLKDIFVNNCKYYPEGLHQDDYTKDYVKEITESGFFTDIISWKHKYLINYTKDDYRNYITSLSWIIKLDESTRKDVMNKVDALLNEYAWSMEIPHGTALIMAEVKK